MRRIRAAVKRAFKLSASGIRAKSGSCKSMVLDKLGWELDAEGFSDICSFDMVLAKLNTDE